VLLAWLTAAGMAGSVIEVRNAPDGARFDVVGSTGTGGSEIVNWEGRPLRLMILADLSVSVVMDPNGPAHEIQNALLAAYNTMLAHPIPGDQLGVTVFAGNAQPWVPLGPINRPGLDSWLAAFGPAEHAPLPYDGAPTLRPGQWTEQPILPTDLELRPFDTDPFVGLQTALVELRGSSNPLKAIVVLWDGEQTTESETRGLLNRVWNREIHVFTIAVGDVVQEGLAARGGGDVYLAQGAADAAMRRIIEQLRMPEP
jgi:hypothetical protein